MALSLAKQTVNNASGTYTPNALLYGFFHYNQVGAIHINAPQFAADGQLLVFSFHQPGSDAGWEVTWDEAYKVTPGETWPDGFFGQNGGGKAFGFHDSDEVCLFYRGAYSGE